MPNYKISFYLNDQKIEIVFNKLNILYLIY